MIKVLFDLNFDMIVYFITFFGLIQEKDNYSTRSGMTTAATIYNNNPVPVVHNAAVRIRTKVGSTSKYSANPPHTPNKNGLFLIYIMFSSFPFPPSICYFVLQYCIIEINRKISTSTIYINPS